MQSFGTYGTQRPAIVMCGNIDFIYVLIEVNNIESKKNRKYRIRYTYIPRENIHKQYIKWSSTTNTVHNMGAHPGSQN